jgi:hypothetical protein
MMGVCALCAAALWPSPLSGQVAVEIDPPRLEVSTFSGQRRVRITARVGEGARPVIVIRSSGAEAVFNRKVRVGPVWLNSSQVHITGAPALTLSFAPAALDTLLGRPDITEHRLDIDAIREHLHVEPAEADLPEIRDAYLALKSGDGSYRFVEGGEEGVRAGDASGSYRVELPWPMTAPTATYDVSVYECRDGRVTSVTTTPFEVVQVGLGAWLAALATHRASLYGALAVAVTMSLGFGIDALASLLRRRVGGRGRPGGGHSAEQLRAH